MAPHASNREQDCLLCACTCKSTQACSRHRPAQNCKASRPQQNSIKDFPSDEWTIGAWNNGNKVTASMPWSGVMHFRVEGEMSKRQTSYGGLAAIIDMAFCQELNASPPLWMNEMKGWVTERERVRVAGRKMEESLSPRSCSAAEMPLDTASRPVSLCYSDNLGMKETTIRKNITTEGIGLSGLVSS